MEIGKRLKELRKERSESQEKIARAVDTTVRNYYRVESGEGLPELPVFCALADHFQANADYLLGLTDVREMRPPSVQREALP